MNAESAARYLPCYRAGKRMSSRILKAVRVAEGDGTLREKLADQMDFDEQVVDAIHSIKPPADLRQRLSELSGQGDSEVPKLRKNAAHPAIICAIAGVLLIAGLLIYQEIDRRTDFPGKENVERLLASLSKMTGLELEPARGDAGTLGDWFYVRGFDGFVLPPELGTLPAVGGRTMKMNGHAVGQLAVDRHEAILNVFRAEDFDVELEDGGAWKFFEKEEWGAAISQKGGMCTVLALHGDRAEAEKFIQELKP